MIFVSKTALCSIVLLGVLSLPRYMTGILETSTFFLMAAAIGSGWTIGVMYLYKR